MAIKLDLKDRKILYYLDLDSRQSFSSLSKKVGLNKKSVINRVNYLLKEEVIKNFKTVVDFGKLGFSLVNFYFDLKLASHKVEEEIINFLCANKIVYRVCLMDGRYNLKVQIISKDMQKVHSFWEEIFEKYVNYIKSRQIVLVTKNNYYHRPYLLDLKKNNLEQLITTQDSFEKIDETDFKLLRVLTRGARTSILELAEKAKITSKTVIERIKNLKKKKIIVGYNLSLDLDKIGYQAFKVSFILTRVTKKRISDFQNYVRANVNIVFDEKSVGGDDYEIEVQVKNISELRHIIKDIQLNFSDIIHDYQILHVFKTYKGLSFPENI